MAYTVAVHGGTVAQTQPLQLHRGTSILWSEIEPVRPACGRTAVSLLERAWPCCCVNAWHAAVCRCQHATTSPPRRALCRWIKIVRYAVRCKVAQLMGAAGVAVGLAGLGAADLTLLDALVLGGIVSGSVGGSLSLWCARQPLCWICGVGASIESRVEPAGSHVTAALPLFG